MPRFSRIALVVASAGSIAWEANAIRTVVNDAAILTDEWGLYDSKKGPQHTNVSQGSLGDCYYLAGLAALAKTHPETIKQAFVTKGEVNSLGRSIYKLRFMVDGEVKYVAIDDSVPFFEKEGYKSHFYFARFGQSEEAWPALLEKGFAKLFGSYFAIRGGWAFQTFKAITQAPVDMLKEESTDTVWDFITEAHKNNWPVTGGSINNDFGTVGNHAFVILSTGTKEGKKAIEVYNPWSKKNEYAGVLKHLSSRKVGDYWLTLEEFGRGFDTVTRARILPDAHLSNLTIPAGSLVAVRFTTKLTRARSHDNPDFYVQLEWPDEKLMPDECQIRIPETSIFMTVGLESAGPSGAVDAKRPLNWNQISNMRATLPATAGTYVALIGSHFEKMPSVKDIVVNVYAEEKVTIQQVDTASVIKSLYGLCDDLTWSQTHFKRASDFRGSPAWEAVEADPAKAKDPDVLWIGAQGLQVSSSRSNYKSYYPSFKVSDLQCLDSAMLHFFDNCKTVTWKNYYSFEKDGEFAGAPTFTSSKGFTLYFEGGEWTVAKPGVYGRYFQKGTDKLECEEASASALLDFESVIQAEFQAESQAEAQAEAQAESQAEIEKPTLTLTMHELETLDFEEIERRGFVQVWNEENQTWTGPKEVGEGPENPKKVQEALAKFGADCEWIGKAKIGARRIHNDPRQPAVWQVVDDFAHMAVPSLYYIRKDGVFTSVLGLKMMSNKIGYETFKFWSPDDWACRDKELEMFSNCDLITANRGWRFVPDGYYPEGSKFRKYEMEPGFKTNGQCHYNIIWIMGHWSIMVKEFSFQPGEHIPKVFLVPPQCTKYDMNFKCYKNGVQTGSWLELGQGQEQQDQQEEELQLLQKEALEEAVQTEADGAEATTVDCDQDVVAKNIARYTKLDNFQELKTGKDSLFPEELKSIGDPNKDCGDSARGTSTSCADLNNWRSITEKYGKPSITP